MMSMILRRLLPFLLVGVLLGLGLLRAEAPASQPAQADGNDYLLRPSDLLHFQVFQEEDLTREVRISQDYTITLPLIGTVSVKGKTLRQLEQQVRVLYDRDYLVNPQVTLLVREYAKRTVDVQGQVGQPGAVEFPHEKGLTLLGAIARAGGFTRLSDKSKVMLTRTNVSGQRETIRINANELIEGRSKEPWALNPDDSIFVPERIL
jgi:polysaccharide export outer membrane protein